MNPKIILALAICTSVIASPPAQSQTAPVTTMVWRPEPGVASKVFSDSVRGYEQIRYMVDLRSGEILETELNHRGTASLYHNITSPSGATLFVGSIDGNRYQAPIRDGGRYEVLVYLMRNDARRGKRVDFTLRFRRTDRSEAYPPAAGPPRPSFDCRRSSGRIEEAICSTPSLAALDARLDLVHRDATSRARGRRVNEIRVEQRAWMKERDTCERQRQLTACLERKYLARIGRLEPKT